MERQTGFDTLEWNWYKTGQSRGNPTLLTNLNQHSEIISDCYYLQCVCGGFDPIPGAINCTFVEAHPMIKILRL